MLPLRFVFFFNFSHGGKKGRPERSYNADSRDFYLHNIRKECKISFKKNLEEEEEEKDYTFKM